ncbi:MAG: coenzyme F420-0:L-glutamate ligase [Methanocalculus sp.]|uniref:coenzyme F420-0:L-glutamate ligase n=1 Tax=Methanocalculus sp. TaxID=2004547 RepID=UPI0027183B12|nr:coenzyme F420-0:L-glutamate ligase [Methanocalculus sp.]MDO9540234.1 coenzyme F420-0:L-glutamate ligase [Methanocalculus sp.]
MFQLPSYVGPCAFGIRMGIIVPGTDLQRMLLDVVVRLDSDGMLEDGDVLSITESIVARAQNNMITTEKTAEEIQKILSLTPSSRVGVVFPIASRNRFSLILESIAKAVPEGEVIVQFSYPDDEVGNQIIPPEVAEELDERYNGLFTPEEINGNHTHPLTGVNYLSLYEEIIRQEGAKPSIILCNDPKRIAEFNPDGVIIANIHPREKTKKLVKTVIANCCTLQEVCSSGRCPPSSEWGLLGSNMSSGCRLKLAPFEAEEFVCYLQEKILGKTGKRVEILVSGDGAYKDPSSGIYELADPKAAFGATPGIKAVLREGVKMKYLIDKFHGEGRSEIEIMEKIAEESQREKEIHCVDCLGTTPRKMEDVLASLADLITGSADAGTPLVLIKGIYRQHSS